MGRFRDAGVTSFVIDTFSIPELYGETTEDIFNTHGAVRRRGRAPLPGLGPIYIQPGFGRRVNERVDDKSCVN